MLTSTTQPLAYGNQHIWLRVVNYALEQNWNCLHIMYFSCTRSFSFTCHPISKLVSVSKIFPQKICYWSPHTGAAPNYFCIINDTKNSNILPQKVSEESLPIQWNHNIFTSCALESSHYHNIVRAFKNDSDYNNCILTPLVELISNDMLKTIETNG